MMMNINLSSSSLGAQKQNKTRRRQTSVHCRFLCVHRSKTKKDDDERQLVIFFFGCKETKQKNNKHQLVVIFSQCTKTKQQRQ
jgi:hypothetical protein